MSRTRHHRNQKAAHCGYDYGGRYNCNKNYCGGYGSYARKLAHKELREDGKALVQAGIDDEGEWMTFEQLMPSFEQWKEWELYTEQEMWLDFIGMEFDEWLLTPCTQFDTVHK